MAEDLTNAISDGAEAPKRVKTNAGEAEAHPLPDLIAADRYLQAKEAAARKTSGLRFAKLVPPGAT